jgi:hypothetical protein
MVKKLEEGGRAGIQSLLFNLCPVFTAHLRGAERRKQKYQIPWVDPEREGRTQKGKAPISAAKL